VDRERVAELLRSRDFTDLCRKHRVVLAVLFGSRAGGRAARRSDTDLAVLTNGIQGLHSRHGSGGRTELLKDLVCYLQSSAVDLVILNHANSLLRFEIAKTGKPVYEETPGAFADFCSLAVRQHEDSRLFYRAMDRYLGRASERGEHSG
jgi:hypothetical protein